MMKRGKKVLGMVLAFAVLVGCNAATVKAATTSATLNSSDTTVTVTYDNAKSSTIAYVSGYEIHSQTGDVHYYNQQKSTTVTGTVSFSFSASTGYKFQLSYGSTHLTAKIVVGGTTMAEVQVTH